LRLRFAPIQQQSERREKFYGCVLTSWKNFSASGSAATLAQQRPVPVVAIELRRDNPQFDKSSETPPFAYGDTLNEHFRQRYTSWMW